jgi:cell division septal protein FtsQ
MTVESGKASGERARGIPLSAYIILAVVLAVAGGFWFLDWQSKRMPVPKVVLTPEAKAYVRYLTLGDVTMKATDAYLRQTLVEILGKITNFGDRDLASVEVNCVFYDSYGQVVLRERVPIVRGDRGGIKPGETKDFRLAFDTIPESWNLAMPQLVIARIIFN